MFSGVVCFLSGVGEEACVQRIFLSKHTRCREAGLSATSRIPETVGQDECVGAFSSMCESDMNRGKIRHCESDLVHVRFKRVIPVPSRLGWLNSRLSQVDLGFHDQYLIGGR